MIRPKPPQPDCFLTEYWGSRLAVMAGSESYLEEGSAVGWCMLCQDGEKAAARQTVAHNTSVSYGRRNPTAVIIPTLMRVNDLEISHSNNAY